MYVLITPYYYFYALDVIPDNDSALSYLHACVAVRDLLFLLKKEGNSDNDLADMDFRAQSLGPLLRGAMGGFGEHDQLINLNRPKVHAPLHFRCVLRSIMPR